MSKPRWKREANREHDARRRAEQPWRRWYKTAQWQAIRAHQLAAVPLCQRCSTDARPVPATVCHHVVPHRGDETLFWSGPFASSCADCHDIDEQRIERGSAPRQVLADDGWPIGLVPVRGRATGKAGADTE